MNKYMKYLILIVSFIIIDYIAIQTFIINFYDNSSIRESFLIFSAILAWIIIPCGLIYFVKDKKNKLLSGAIYGFVVYGVYAFTTFAIVKDWQYTTLFADIIWGPIICTAITALGIKIKAIWYFLNVWLIFLRCRLIFLLMILLHLFFCR